jgi:hypothetical protein
MAKSNGASNNTRPISEDVLFRMMSELISLREKVEQAELAAHVYRGSVMGRARDRSKSKQPRDTPGPASPDCLAQAVIDHPRISSRDAYQPSAGKLRCDPSL